MSQAVMARPEKPKIRLTKLFIDNTWVDPAEGGSFETFNPATGEPIARVAAGNRRGHRSGGQSGPSGTRVRSLVQDGRGRSWPGACSSWPIWSRSTPAELAALESLNCGKTITDATGDIQGVVNSLRYYGGWADKIEGRTVPVRGNFLCYTLRQPVGVVGQIIPWNFPLMMMAWKIGPALACGNTIVLKPAEQTPLSALRLAELAVEAGLPPGVLNIVNGFGETAGAALCVHPDVDKIAFTGHVDTAKIIQRATADTLKRTSYELGGKSPNVIFADADLDEAVDGAFHAIYFHGGQCCTAGSRLFVEEKIRDEFVSRLAAKARRRIIGDPLDPATEQGPQVSERADGQNPGLCGPGTKTGCQAGLGRQTGRPAWLLRRADDFRRRSRRHGDRPGRDFWARSSACCRSRRAEEVFDRANRTYYGLAAGVWTKDIDKAHLFAKHVKAGTVWVNCYHIVDTTTPFGGFKMSGHGRENGEAALDLYSEMKTVTVKLGD